MACGRIVSMQEMGKFGLSSDVNVQWAGLEHDRGRLPTAAVAKLIATSRDRKSQCRPSHRTWRKGPACRGFAFEHPVQHLSTPASLAQRREGLSCSIYEFIQSPADAPPEQSSAHFARRPCLAQNWAKISMD